jgi:uncharacterized protein YaaW (UPF0174 family)
MLLFCLQSNSYGKDSEAAARASYLCHLSLAAAAAAAAAPSALHGPVSWVLFAVGVTGASAADVSNLSWLDKM